MLPSPDPRRNQLLAALPTEEYEWLLPDLEALSLEFKQYLYDINEPIPYVYFVLNGIISLVTVLEDGSTVETATVGNEGFVGLPILLGTAQIPGQAFAQVPGSAVRMDSEVFKRKVTPDTALYTLLLRYTQILLNQIAQTAACNCAHSIEERFCRWVLMTRDRVDSDQFPLTQEFLGQMLGVRRASVSVVASIMQKAGFIQYRRGKMTIIDREGLESTSCECYGIIKAEFQRLFSRD